MELTMLTGAFDMLMAGWINGGISMNMRHNVTVLATLFVLLQQTLAQDTIVYGSVVFSRTGRRTPLVNATRDALSITNTGAWQALNAGNVVKTRYLDNDTKIAAFNEAIIDPLQVYALASGYSDYTVQSARAFMQGLFPPSSITNSTASQSDPRNILYDGSYIATPGNVQYPSVYTAGQSDPNSIYLDSANYCPAWYDEYLNYYNHLLSAPQPKNQDLYQRVATILSNDVLSPSTYNYANADSVYDYMNDQYQSNSTVHEILNNGVLGAELAYANLRYNSDSLNTAVYASPSTSPVNTIAGSGLATQILQLLELNVGTLGQLNKLSILVGDFAPLLSFFGLADLPQSSGDNFLGLPQYGSLAIFELYSFANGTQYQNITSPLTGTPLQYPQMQDLYVRFLFANGSDDTTATSYSLSPESLQLQEYPLFVTSPSAGSQVMTWGEFTTAMTRISIGSYAEWCSMCNAWETSMFCLANNNTALNDVFGPHHHHYDPRSKWLAPAVAGTIGALVTLAVVGIALLLALFIGGVGFSRRREPIWARENKHKLGLGGFKGGRKMASDADLTVTKGGAGINAVEKERVGSWELRPDPQSPNIDSVARHGVVEDRGMQPQTFGAAPVATQEHEQQRAESVISSARTSIDQDDMTAHHTQNPVLPHERV